MRKAIAVAVLMLVLTSSTFAGIIQCGDAPPPPPPTDTTNTAQSTTTDTVLETVLIEVVTLVP